jgi:hypothetical protein
VQASVVRLWLCFEWRTRCPERPTSRPAAFSLEQGLGRRPALLDNSAYTESRSEVERLLPSVVRAPQRRGREIESLGIEL